MLVPPTARSTVSSTSPLSEQPISQMANQKQARPPNVGQVRARLARSRRGQDIHPTCTFPAVLDLDSGLQTLRSILQLRAVPSSPAQSSLRPPPAFPLASPRQDKVKRPRLDSPLPELYTQVLPPPLIFGSRPSLPCLVRRRFATPPHFCPSWRASTPMSTRTCPAATGTTTVSTSVCSALLALPLDEDADKFSTGWGVLENYEVVRKIGMCLHPSLVRRDRPVSLSH